jgi:RNA recognition motif-containing protein
MEARLYIANLSGDVKEADLVGFFIGKHIDADITMPRSMGKGKGYAFAQLNTSEAAKAAMEICDGMDFQGRRLVVRPAFQPAVRRVSP